MKFRNNLKRFFTLDRHHAEGFTLVELIVVIAILAILAGIGVPAYSGYITKTNKQADITLVSDIQYALTLAGYNNTFDDGESGYLALSVDGVTGVAEGSNLEKALIASFGSNYADTLKLKYNGWDDNGMLSSLLAGTDPIGDAKNVMESPYITGNSVENLMGDVEDLTNAAAGLVSSYLTADNRDSTNAYNAVAGLFVNGENNAFNDAFTEVFGEKGDKSKLTEDQLANLMVLAAAKDVTSGTTSTGGTLVYLYAGYVAFASTEAGKADAGIQAAYQNLQTALQSPNNDDGSYSDYVFGALGEFENAMDLNAADKGEAYKAWLANGMQASITAFTSIMSAVNNAEMTPSELNSATLFTEGKGIDLFNNYLATAKAVSQMDADTIAALKAAQVENGVVITYSQNGVEVVVADTLPNA